jgi:hypothetical protein
MTRTSHRSGGSGRLTAPILETAKKEPAGVEAGGLCKSFEKDVVGTVENFVTNRSRFP